MSPRERVIKAFRREKSDKVPKDFWWTPQIYGLISKMTGSPDILEYFGCEMREVRWLPTKKRRDFSGYLGAPPLPFCEWVYHAEDVFNKIPPSCPWIDEQWGVGHIPTSSQDAKHRHLYGYVYPMRNLKTIRELKDYPFSDYQVGYRYKHLGNAVKEIHTKELYAVAIMECTIFEVSWQLRGMAVFFLDFTENRHFAKYLLDYITEMRKFMIRHFVEAEVDLIHLGDDVGTQRGMLMSPDMWREWFKKRMHSIISVAKKINPEVTISYHSDGNIEEIIPELIEIGVDVLNPVQPEAMDPVKLKKTYGNDLSFWGTMGGQTTIPFGTPEQVKQEVRERVETVGRGGGLLIAPGHMLQPEVPWENIVAFFEAVEEYGKY